MTPERACLPLLEVIGILSLTMLILAHASPALAVETCKGPGAGFERLDPGDDESGVGGTGAQPSEPRRSGEFARSDSGEDESGIGGTGRSPDTRVGDDESGVGGTGLYGVIDRILEPSPEYGHTRICLGGVAVQIPQSLEIEAPAAATSQSAHASGGATALAVGRLAYLEALSTNDGLVARRLIVEPDEAGQIETVRPGRRGADGGNARRTRLHVSGRIVEITPATRFEFDSPPTKIAAGDWIRFQGHRLPDGTTIATRIAKSEAGVVIERDRPLATFVPELLGRGDRPAFAYVSVEGVVERAGTGPRVAGLRVALSEAGPDSQAQLRNGDSVRISGRIDTSGTLHVEPPPAWLERALRRQRKGAPGPQDKAGDRPSQAPDSPGGTAPRPQGSKAPRRGENPSDSRPVEDRPDRPVVRPNIRHRAPRVRRIDRPSIRRKP